MGFSRVFKKKSEYQPMPQMEISDPVSQNYDYGGAIPPWMNSYADLATVQVQAVPTRARHYADDSVAPPPRFPMGNFHYSNSNSPIKKELHSPLASPRSSTSSSSASSINSITLEPAITSYQAPPVKRSGLRNRLFRNRGLNADGSLRDEYDDLGMPEWGIPDEFATPKRRGTFGW